MHQILGLRLYFNPKKQKHEKTDGTFFARGWRFESIPKMLQSIDEVLKQIPPSERWDLYYTVPSCGDGKREFKSQSEIIFDIDGIDQSRIASYSGVVCAALGVACETTGCVASGNGLHFIVSLNLPIEDSTYFDKQRRHYAAVCEKIKLALDKAGLPGKPDPAVFDHRRIMRLPGTENRKEGKPVTHCRILQGIVTPVAFDLALASGLPSVTAAEQIQPQTAKLATPDTEAILNGCDFLKHCKEKPNEISEAQWYAMLSILPRLPPNGRALAHEYSAGHSKYSPGECETKIDQALQASGPRTCSNLQDLWGKCEACPNFGKVTSPIMIQGPRYISTKDSGFYSVFETDKGDVKRVPNYDDLVLYFESLHEFVTIGGSGVILTWNGTFWEEIDNGYLNHFAETNFNPSPTEKMRMEFRNKIACRNPKKAKWFVETTNKRLNFKNGILDLNTMILQPHSTQYGFRHVLSYPYDPEAKAPQFEKFLHDVMKGRQDLIDVLLEFAGYCFSNDECWAQKALIMTGEGSNGKSTFMDVLKALAGEGNYSSITLGDIKSEANRKMLDGKLFNMAEETPTHAMAESSVFKNLISGGETTIKVLYKQPYSIANKAKLMFACNELPQTKDTTRGYLRRLLIVPFDKKFEGAEKDYFIKEKLLEELSGIFNLVIAGYHRLRLQRGFSQSDAIQTELAAYNLDIDNIKAWFEECLFLTDAKSTIQTSLTDLYTSYTSHCLKCGEKMATRNTVAKRLKFLLPEYETRRIRPMVDGKREILFTGVKITGGTSF